MFYSFSFLIAISTLILWFLVQEKEALNRLFSKVFLASIAVYAISVIFSEGSVEYKFQIAFRDFMLLGFTGILSIFFGKNKQAMLAIAAGFGVVMAVCYLPVLDQTFPENRGTIAVGGLDEKAELLVEIKEQHQFSELKNLVDQYELTYESAFRMESNNSTDLDDYYAVNIPDAALGQLEQIKTDFWQSGLIDWLEENEQITLSPIEARSPIPSEKKYGINDPEVRQLWGFEAMEMDKFYSFLKSKKVKPQKKALIAILDTGVDAQHEDLQANYRSISDLYDKDVRGHGTHCAGIAAAVTNNGKGVASFSPNGDFVEITSIKVLMDYGYGTQRTIINGMLEAADKGAAVISMSLGGRSKNSKQNAYQKAVDYANQKGAIVIAAAGNSNANAKGFSPANAPGIISVSAIDTVLNRASFSNYISDLPMGIAAPGVKIYSTFPKDEYKTFNGTSMATPYVAGLVALMKSLRPELTTKEAYQILQKTGKKTKKTNETGRLIMPEKAIRLLLEG